MSNGHDNFEGYVTAKLEDITSSLSSITSDVAEIKEGNSEKRLQCETRFVKMESKLRSLDWFVVAIATPVLLMVISFALDRLG